jgi:predicted amidohydrolase YtcJ
MKKIISLSLLLISIYSCKQDDDLDLLIINGDYYTASTNSEKVSAIGVSDGIISYVGDRDNAEKRIGENTKIIDAAGQFVMPGFIEGHGHFSGLGASLQNLNFLKDTSWQVIIQKVQKKAETAKEGEWIYGRGWHQEKWKLQPDEYFSDYPTHESLSSVSPDNPVLLVHASGHSLFANEKAMNLAGISNETADLKGGKIIRDNSGNAIGVFEERAMTPIKEAYNEYLKKLDAESQAAIWYASIDLAQQECLKNGITSFQDAGSLFYELDRYTEMAEQGELDIRLWAMMRDSLTKAPKPIADYRKIDIGNGHFTCRAIKSEIDGALGAHGAWLLQPYDDKKGFYGQNTTEISTVKDIAKIAYENNMQLCVHAIGDRANKETLDIIESYHNKSEEDLRWRVEHAQHLSPADIQRFKSTGAIASMQGVHCTSDAPFVQRRLGLLRSKIGAYAWKALLDQGVKIVNGTDVPVEVIDPIENFYASVTRKRLDNGMEFFVENRMSREQALRSYTIDAAYGAFQDNKKGSLEIGKYGDIVILDKNLLTCDDLDIPRTNITHTIVGGKILYKNNSK